VRTLIRLPALEDLTKIGDWDIELSSDSLLHLSELMDASVGEVILRVGSGVSGCMFRCPYEALREGNPLHAGRAVPGISIENAKR
jgi:hypothetical protein